MLFSFVFLIFFTTKLKMDEIEYNEGWFFVSFWGNTQEKGLYALSIYFTEKAFGKKKDFIVNYLTLIKANIFRACFWIKEDWVNAILIDFHH